jgi:hypothetical protein
MTVLAMGSVKVLNEWVGDLAAMLWVTAGFLAPYLIGIGLRQRAAGTQGRLIGALMGALIVLVPTVSYALVAQPDLAEMQMPLLWALFTPLALVQGAIALPVGSTVRKTKAT